MKKKAIILASLLFLFCVFTSAKDNVNETEIGEKWKAYLKAKNSAERAEIARSLLNKYPENKYTLTTLDSIISHQHGELKNTKEVIAFSESLLERVKDEKIKKRIKFRLLELYSKAGMQEKFKPAFNQLFEPKSLDFRYYMDMMKFSAEIGDWHLLSKAIAASEPIANEESFKARYPDRKFSEEYLKERCDNRKGIIAFYKAWKMANTGKLKASLSQFDAANKLCAKNFFGVSNEEFCHVLWGKALLFNRDYEAGFEKIVRAVLWSREKNLLEHLRQAYITKEGGENGFDEYAMNLRKKYSKKIGDFSAKDFQGKMHTFEELKGKVTILQFWAHPCGPCHDQLILLKSVFDKYRKKGLAYIAYTLEPSREHDLKFIADNKLEYSFLSIDEGEDWSQYRDRFYVVAFPTTYLIDEEERILYYHFGFYKGDEEKIAEEIARMIS